MSGLHLFTLAKVPVWVSPWYLLLLVYFGMGNPKAGIIFACTITLSLLVHEFGHALMAKRYKLGPQILLHGFGGLTGHQRAQTNGQDALIIAAGPFAGFMLALAAYGASYALYRTDIESDFLDLLLVQLVQFNLFWSVFNMIPMWPM